MDSLEAIRATFFQECDELLGDLEARLLVLEAGEGDGETINAVFRAVHSIKGGAGAFGLDDLVRFAHVLETLLDELRSGRRPCDDATVRTLLRASDLLADHVAAATGAGPQVEPSRSQVVVTELQALTWEAGAEVPLPEDEDFGFEPLTAGLPPLPGALPPLPPLMDLPALGSSGWRIVFKPRGRMYANANETGLLLRELALLAPTSVTVDDRAVPLLDELDPEENHLVWTIDLGAGSQEAAVREVFDFVESDCELCIRMESGETAAADDDVNAQELDLDIAALLASVQEAPHPTEAASPEAPSSPPVVASPQPAAAPAASSGGAPATIRVDLERVDRLINVVGELVIQQAMLAQRVMESGLARSSGVSVGLEDLELLTREIQDSVMAIRAQPVKSVFQRMPRLVREVAAMTGKSVRLITEGEATEVDKTVVERLAEPITHMLRNAIDHGLETPDERERAGKSPDGTVRLAALHRSGRIVIEIRDDGRGINRERVRRIAVERGLIPEDAALSDDEIDNLIFLPGFSTADAVSDISGRGVGMDVVKRSIQSLGGRISISSTPGKGSTFTLSLPLTLAVLDGMVLGAADQTLVAPLSTIVESLTLRVGEIHHVGGRDAVIRFRDAFVPLIDVAQSMGFRDQAVAAGEGVAVVVETEGGSRAALMVDAIHGQRQVVIKSLETNYQQVEGIAAATILGDGRVALILDIDAIVANARRGGGVLDLKLAS